MTPESVTQDGSMVYGYRSISTFVSQAVRWTASQGVQLVNTPPLQSSGAGQCSSDGSRVIVGGLQGINQVIARYRVPEQAFDPVGFLPSYVGLGISGMSGDGEVISGHGINSNSSAKQAFRWTLTGGTQPLGFARPGDSYSETYGISRDGSTIVGTSRARARATGWPSCGGRIRGWCPWTRR